MRTQKTFFYLRLMCMKTRFSCLSRCFAVNKATDAITLCIPTHTDFIILGMHSIPLRIHYLLWIEAENEK